MKVQVVHMRDFGKTSKKLDDGSYYIYCGRPSRLKNSHYMKDESQRAEVIRKCDADENFHLEVKSFIKWLDKSNIKDVKLGCFCAPKPCHCDIIKREILLKIKN